MPVDDRIKGLLKEWQFSDEGDQAILEKFSQEAVAVFLEHTQIELEITEDGQIMARLYDSNFDHYKEIICPIEKLRIDYFDTYATPAPIGKIEKE